GIRDKLVTGVQTCALPISFGKSPKTGQAETQTQTPACNSNDLSDASLGTRLAPSSLPVHQQVRARVAIFAWAYGNGEGMPKQDKIGRASCRERVEIAEVDR